jgi:hypothetical protein
MYLGLILACIVRYLTEVNRVIVTSGVFGSNCHKPSLILNVIGAYKLNPRARKKERKEEKKVPIYGVKYNIYLPTRLTGSLRSMIMILAVAGTIKWSRLPVVTKL